VGGEKEDKMKVMIAGSFWGMIISFLISLVLIHFGIEEPFPLSILNILLSFILGTTWVSILENNGRRAK
jgi:uncharacterized protein YacL